MMNVQVDLNTTQKISQPAEVERLFADLDKPSLHALSYALRHPDTWPEGFVWDYSDCDNCAMGLAHQLWKRKVPKVYVASGPSVMARVFAMPYAVADSIFVRPVAWAYTASKRLLWWPKKCPIPLAQITPEMVADQIDKYLETVGVTFTQERELPCKWLTVVNRSRLSYARDKLLFKVCWPVVQEGVAGRPVYVGGIAPLALKE
jgi:hypothetical protein